ncbi:sulfite exporter TauE/SafE family protein [Desulfonatronum thioautotrophicum]|uniref:sulfite exporter TauE/SafE family protein n=1 Tax=Desulfonatronum thioautotrophicum TaxID=617001 RepID=UPI0005EB0B26|nr:sulfite exporter TauE/SafE family protein [Desulfonatronum thioautotrophicum]
MIDLLFWPVILFLTMIAGTIGGAVGFGSAVILLPVCSFVFGPEAAVPILTLAALIGNLSRAAFSWSEINWPIVTLYCLGAVPMAALGGMVFVALDQEALQRILGLFILAMLPLRRWSARHGIVPKQWHFLPLGAGMGFLSGVVGTVGPINAPFFLAYGLVKGAYLATEALGAAAVHLTKSGVYGRFAAIDVTVLTYGLVIGATLIFGSWAGKRLIVGLETQRFIGVVEVFLVVAALLMIIGF